MNEKSSSIHGIHYEVSKPVQNWTDGYYYQRVRQVDGNGNLVGIGEQIHRSARPGSEDGLFASPLDLGKLGILAGDAGQTLYGGIAKDLRTMAIDATRFARDAAAGLTDGYKSWPGTHAPWEPMLDWRTGSSGVEHVQDGGVGGIGDGGGIGNWRENPQSISRIQPQSDRWASIPVPNFSPPPQPRVPEWNDEFVRDSASGAGVPSRKNVFEYGFPDPGAAPAPISEASPIRKLSSWRVRSDGSLLSERLNGRMTGPEDIDTRTSCLVVGATDPSNRDASPAGGLLGLLQEHLRNSRERDP
jgi:hypothetical protein